MAKQQTYDATKMGPLSWRQLQLANQNYYANLEPGDDLRAIMDANTVKAIPNSGSPELNWEGRVQSPIMRNSNGRDYWGKSMWDEQVADANDFYNNLSDLRGQNQPWYAQLGAGLLKGVTTAATTWLDGTVGLLYGLGAAAGTALFDDKATGWDAAAKIFHNSVSDSLQDFNEFMEEFAPNYKSRDEENNKWYQNMGTMNFWADGLIKNLGFTIGAFYSGGAFTKAIKGVGGLIAAGKAGKAAKAYKAAKVEEIMKANPKMTAEEAAKAVNPMATATRYTNTLNAIEGARSGTGIAVAGSLFSAVNEGRIEANQVYRDAFTLGNTPEESKGAAAEILAARNRKMQEIEDDQTLLPSEKQALQAQVQANSQKLLAEAEQNAAKAGMLTLGLNIPILTIDNFKMYGRLYSRGFKQSVKQVGNNVTTQELKAAQDAVKNATTKQEKEAAKRALKEAERKAKAAHNARNNARVDDVAENVTDKEGRLAWNEITKGQAAWKGIKSGLMEGNEEMMQAWASGTAGNMTMPEDPDAYYKALTDPNATVKTNDFLTSVTKGFLDSYGNMDRWEEGAIGFLTGILGMPTFGVRANSDSNTYLGRGKMVGLSGGFFGEFSNANYLNRLGAESVKNINAFRDKYRQHAQFLAQSQAFTDAMDGYLQDKNEFAYNNARDNDDYAMIQALAVTGRIDEVKAMLNFKEEDLTDDILDSIANDFTENSNLVDSDGNPKTVDDSGKPLQGAWRDKAGNPMSKTAEGKAEMKAKLLKKQKRLNEEIDDYVASLDSVRAQVNNSLDESQVRELAWLDWKNKQWSRRFQDIQGTQEKAFDRLLEATEEALNAKTDEGGQYYTNEADSPIKREKLENLRDLLKEMKKAKSPREILNLLIKNTDTINSLFRKPEASEKEATLYDVVSGWINDPVALADLAESLYDIRLMAIAQKQFSDKLDEYTSNPSKLAENRQRIEEERQETQSITDDINTVERVKNMSVSDMSKLSNEDLNGLASSISNLDEESTDKIKQRQEINSLSDTVKAKIQEREDLSGAEKADLIALNEVQRQMSDSVDNYLNTETEALITASENLDENQTPNNTDVLRDILTAVREEKASGKSIESTNIVDPSTMLDNNETGHDPTSTVNTAQEARQEKEDKQKKEEEEKRSTEETNKIWDELIALAAKGKEAEMANKAHSIRSIIRKKIGEAVDKGDTPITEAQTGNYIVAAMRSQPYKDMEQLVSEENKSALLPTLRDVIAKYVQYYNGLLAERNATSTTNTASAIEEDPRTPDVTEDDLINYAESVKNNQRETRAEERDTWHPNTSHYGFGVSEFGTPKYDDKTGLELKFYERVTGEKPEGHYSAKVRAKIETIAKWFEKKGVYDNIDTALGGRVKAGHKVVFTTSDELNKEVKEAVKKATGEDIEPVIILMAVEIDGALHIMGDLKSVIGIEDSGIIDTPLNNFSVAFNSAYGKWKAENKQGTFTFGETVIKQGMVGRMIFNNKTEFNTLNSVFGDKLHLGIALKDDKTEALDVITTPGKSKKNEKSAEEKGIRRPNNIKAGQPFVVIPSMISGASIAVPFVTPTLDEVMSRQDANELLIVQNIKSVLSRLALTDFDSMPEEELKNELLNIKDEIKSYINVDFFLSYDKKTHQIKFNGTKDDKRIGNFVININVENEDITERERRVINGILADFRKKGVGFQIDRNQINTGNYNKMIGEIAKINLPKNTPYHTSNDWFTVNKVTSTGRTVRGASVIPSLGSNPHAATSEVVVSTKQGQARVDINKKTVTLEDGTVITNLDTNERAKKIWAYGFGQGRRYFENKPTNKTAPYKTPVGWFDPVKTEFINEREAEKRTKNRSNTDNAVNTLIKSITDKYKGDLTFDVSEKSDGYPVVKVTSNNEGDLYTYIFRVKDDNIESAAGWTSDNPANWEVDNSVTNRGGDTISFTPVLDFYKTLGFTPKPTPTTTTQTTTEQQTTVEAKEETLFNNTPIVLDDIVSNRLSDALNKVLPNTSLDFLPRGHYYDNDDVYGEEGNSEDIKEHTYKSVEHVVQSFKIGVSDRYTDKEIDDYEIKIKETGTAEEAKKIAETLKLTEEEEKIWKSVEPVIREVLLHEVVDQMLGEKQRLKKYVSEVLAKSKKIEAQVGSNLYDTIKEQFPYLKKEDSKDTIGVVVFKQQSTSQAETVQEPTPQETKQEVEQKPVENPEQLEKEAQDKLIEEAKAEQQKTPTDYVNGWIEELRNEGNSSVQLYADMWEALGKRGWQEDAFEKTKKKGVPNKDKFIKMMNTIKANYDSTNKKDFTQKIDFKKARYRRTEDNDAKWNKEEEMTWLKRALPQLSNEQRVQIVDGLIKVADSDNPGYAWGQFYRGLITISSEAASGTLYHEAFHAVIDLLMTEDEYNKLFDAAYQVWGNLGMLGLEEKLAEEFRKFVQYGDNAAFVDYDAEDIKTPIIRGIVRLFRRLKALIQGLRNKQIYLNKLFYDINKGKFADRKIKENILDKVTTRQEVDAQLVLDRNPELASVGTAREYAAYINSIFPNSVEKDIYWHGSNENFSDGFNTAKRGEGSGALETKKRNDLYLNKQGWASLQYVNGVNRQGSDKNGFAHWNKLWWELKEIMSNGRRENNDWKDIVITDKDVNSIRQAIPNKRGKFDRDKGGTHGKWLKERKADYGYENKSDKEFFEEVFGLQLGKDTFNTWTARNAEVFKAMETTAKGIYPVVINVTNPIVEEGQNTYYEEQRGLFSQADRNGNDAILSRSADNEFNSDVAVVINANNKNVHWLGTKSDIEQFKQWKAKNVKQPKFDINERELEDIKKKAIADGTFMKAPNGKPTNLNERQWLQVRTKAFKEWFGDWENDPANASKVVDENGEPLEVYHGTRYNFNIFDKEKIGSKRPSYYGKGFYFTPSYNYAKGYSGFNEPMSVFLNIKNPNYEQNYKQKESSDGNWIINVNDKKLERVNDRMDEIIVFNPNQIKSATDNVGTFSRENNNIRYREVATEEEYNSMVEEMGLSRDKADTFIYNFMTKILNVNPRYKVDEKSDALSYFYLDDPTIINQQGKARIENLFKKILGKSQGEYLPLNFDNREAFIKSIDESLADWGQSLIQRINSPFENSAYGDKSRTLRRIKLLQSLLKRDLDLSTFTEEEKELIGSIEGKSKKNIGFAIQKLKRQLPVIEQQIERINFINHAMLVQAKNRLLAIHTIDNIEDIIKDRLLREYDSYTIKDNTYNEKVLPNRKVVEAIKKVLEQKHREGATILFDEKESRESNWNELYNRIVTSYPEYKELLDLFHKANPELKIVVGGNAEMTVRGSELGKFHPKSNTLYLTNESDIFTAIHELAHSATFYGMKGKSEDTESFDSSINKFMDYIREYIKDIQANPALFSNSLVWGTSMPADIYGFTNASEFIAELFGNPSFQELLDTIPAMEESKFKSLLQQVWDMIAEFLNKVFGNNKISKSALDQAKQLGYASMSLQEQHIDLVYKQLEKYTNQAQPLVRKAEQTDQEMSVKQYHFQKLMYVNLSEEDKEYIKERGMSVRDYSSMSQAEKELFWKCR